MNSFSTLKIIKPGSISKVQSYKGKCHRCECTFILDSKDPGVRKWIFSKGYFCYCPNPECHCEVILRPYETNKSIPTVPTNNSIYAEWEKIIVQTQRALDNSTAAHIEHSKGGIDHSRAVFCAQDNEKARMALDKFFTDVHKLNLLLPLYEASNQD